MDRARERLVAANEALEGEVNEATERGEWPGAEDKPTLVGSGSRDDGGGGATYLVGLRPRPESSVLFKTPSPLCRILRA